MSMYIDGPTCKLLFCAYCGRIVDKSVRGRKKTCSDECAKQYQRQVWNRQYAEKMAKDPDFAKKQSANQYARIKADPEKMEQRRISRKERMQLPNYKQSQRRSEKKYRDTDEFRQLNAQRMRRYRDANPDIILKIEERRAAKRSEYRLRLKLEDPEKYKDLIDGEREYLRKLRAEKRLAELQKELSEMVSKDE